MTEMARSVSPTDLMDTDVCVDPLAETDRQTETIATCFKVRRAS